KEGKSKKAETRSAGRDVDGPFDLPPSWAWGRLGDVAQYGLSVKVDSNKDIPDDTWVLDLEDIEKGTSRIVERILSSARPFRSTKTIFKRGDVLFGKLRPYLNKVLVADQDGVCTTEIIPIRGYCGMVPEYVRLVLKSPFTMARVDRLMYGMKMPRLGTEDAVTLSFPLPPLAEQQRIVAKVDELMVLCDRLEVAQVERENRRDRLVAASLHRLNNGADAESFREHARFYLRHLPRLTARPEHIQRLRQTILNLAVRGQLVPQDSEDKSAPAFGIGVNSNQEDRLDLILPRGWSWARVEGVAEAKLGKMLDKARNSGQAFRYLRNTNIHWFNIRIDDLKLLRIEEAETGKYLLRNGDVLICEGGHGIGRTAVWLAEEPDIVFQKALHRVRPGPALSSDFFSYCMFVYSHLGVLQTYFTGVGIPHFTAKALSRLVFPLPPLAEQHRIVAKVDELMGLCDQLEAQLIATQTDSRRLLEATLSEALAA
ncbi:MAG: restriction endonuclease subunit S, partial [Burkholderiales bacterium]